MLFEVIHSKELWDNCLEQFPQEFQDIYFTYDYHYLYKINGEGIPVLMNFIGDNGTKIAYPFLLNNISNDEGINGYFDIQSAYGYGGPLVFNPNPIDICIFEENFCKWCQEQNIIAEFIRFHPILQNYRYFSLNIDVSFNRKTVFVDLGSSLETVWEEQISSKNRNMIRKAMKSEVSIEKGISKADFITLYNKTMNKLNADKYYFFSENYFDNILSWNRDEIVTLTANFEGETIAAGIFIMGRSSIHYHLACSDNEYLKLAPNNLILYKAIEYGIDNGKKYMHLGGGTSSSMEDSLLKYKRSFSNNLLDFYIGKRVHNKKIYDILMSNWELKNGLKRSLFLQYRN